MSTRDRVQNRAELIYGFLLVNMGTGYTKPELCEALDITPSATTESAIKRARDMATEAGYHFPPAVPANGFRYMVTSLAEDAIDPTAHISRIEAGVRARKETGMEFMRRERKTLPNDLRPVVDMMLTVHDATQAALAAIQKAADDMTVSLVKARREQRKAEAS